MLPPYEVRDTLLRLENDISHTAARTIICLGDSFDDLHAAQSLSEDEAMWITRLQAGRKWIWIEGNHDPGPRSEEHTSELQSRRKLVCRLLLEKTNNTGYI